MLKLWQLDGLLLIFYLHKIYNTSICKYVKMIVKLFGILDLVSAIVLFGLQFNFLESLAIPMIIYLLVKGVMFIKDPLSIIEIVIALYAIVLLIGIKTHLTYLFIVYLLYKSFISFM